MAKRDDIPKTDPSEIEALIQRLTYQLLFPLIRNPWYDLRHLRSVNPTIGEYLPPCYLACAKFILFDDRRLDRTNGDSFGLRVH